MAANSPNRKPEDIVIYHPLEERLNIVTHAIGVFFGVIATLFLVRKAILIGDVLLLISFCVFGLSMITLYSASTLYHNANSFNWRKRLRILDHASIYILIAGTYTPFALVTLRGTSGWIIFGAIWGLAIIGIVLKIFFTGRYDRLSTFMYLFMGWVVVLYIKPLLHHLPPEGVLWLVAGGISYSVGAVLYSIKKIKFNHAIFHVFVLAGSICHFISVYFYVLPRI